MAKRTPPVNPPEDHAARIKRIQELLDELRVQQRAFNEERRITSEDMALHSKHAKKVGAAARIPKFSAANAH